ncbi:hypothetical protein FKG94_08665 [Exilibacterium tricleocarpae]|uniref:Uncharacterized protein n=1 Tax=Exilibacterium tricleocarpae TaxID=2591008 RepID=A0A545TVC7_9GAMM|nr:hypothetical protein [Exilibacterium tricleocarpae]TQV81170.1 hypothetical protein FKG94_08665 [Exilibacterium tricleocarpae]
MKYFTKLATTLVFLLPMYANAWQKIGAGTVDYIDMRQWENNNIAVKLSSMTNGCSLGYFGSEETYIREFYSTLLAALHSEKTITLHGETGSGSSCLIKRLRITK